MLLAVNKVALYKISVLFCKCCSHWRNFWRVDFRKFILLTYVSDESPLPDKISFMK